MATNNSEVNYLKIGTFVLVGIGLIIFALLIFGSSKIFQRVVYVETYFDESIQGVSDGTLVKYKGLQIGNVEEIAFFSEIYRKVVSTDPDMHARSIYVKIAITSKLFTSLSDEGVKNFLSQEVVQGLRVKLVVQGLTGTSYLEFDYIDPKEHPVPKLAWTPKFFYVPSVTSTLTRLSENAQYIMNELKDIDFKKIFSDIDKVATTITRVTDKTESLLSQINNPMVRALQNLKIISDNLRETSARLKRKPSELIFSSYPPPLDPNKL